MTIGSAHDALPERSLLSFEDVKDRVRAMSVRGHDDLITQRTLEADGIDPAMIRRAQAELADEERLSQKATWKRAAVVGGALVAVGFALDTWLGTDRGIGAFLVLVVVALIAVGIVFVFRTLRDGP